MGFALQSPSARGGAWRRGWRFGNVATRKLPADLDGWFETGPGEKRRQSLLRGSAGTGTGGQMVQQTAGLQGVEPAMESPRQGGAGTVGPAQPVPTGYQTEPLQERGQFRSDAAGGGEQRGAGNLRGRPSRHGQPVAQYLKGLFGVAGDLSRVPGQLPGQGRAGAEGDPLRKARRRSDRVPARARRRWSWPAAGGNKSPPRPAAGSSPPPAGRPWRDRRWCCRWWGRRREIRPGSGRADSRADRLRSGGWPPGAPGHPPADDKRGGWPHRPGRSRNGFEGRQIVPAYQRVGIEHGERRSFGTLSRGVREPGRKLAAGQSHPFAGRQFPSSNGGIDPGQAQVRPAPVGCGEHGQGAAVVRLHCRGGIGAVIDDDHHQPAGEMRWRVAARLARVEGRLSASARAGIITGSAKPRPGLP